MAKATDAAMRKFEERFAKTFGDGTLEVASKINPWPVISTGSLAVDYALGVGGFVEGRQVEIWGQEGIGKTTFTFWCMAEAQAKHKDKRVAYIDVEQKLDRAWMAANGVDLKRCYIYTPESAEDVADALKEMTRSGLFSMIVVDSIGAMIPEAEKEKDADQAVVANQAKIVTRMVKINAVEARKAGAIVIYINQVRANLSGFGKATMTGGGWALRHATTMKLEFKRTGTTPFKTKVNGEDVIVGHEVAVYVERNGVAPAYRTGFFVAFNQATAKYGPLGLDKVDEAKTLGLKHKVIQQAGAWYTVPLTGERYNGEEKLLAGLREAPDVVAEIRRLVLAEKADEVYDEEVIEPDPEPEAEEREPGTKPNFAKGGVDAGVGHVPMGAE